LNSFINDFLLELLESACSCSTTEANLAIGVELNALVDRIVDAVDRDNSERVVAPIIMGL
jgi:hypothetical protein